VSRIIQLAIMGATLSCVFAPVSPEGEKVSVLGASEVTQCQKVGTASSKTADRVVIFARTDRSIQEEVESLARNEAAGLGGDAIVPTSPIVDGRQSFDVYRCAKP
jgi:hypothetical protein